MEVSGRVGVSIYFPTDFGEIETDNEELNFDQYERRGVVYEPEDTEFHDPDEYFCDEESIALAAASDEDMDLLIEQSMADELALPNEED